MKIKLFVDLLFYFLNVQKVYMRQKCIMEVIGNVIRIFLE